jgi:hypothetical protein
MILGMPVFCPAFLCHRVFFIAFDTTGEVPLWVDLHREIRISFL